MATATTLMNKRSVARHHSCECEIARDRLCNVCVACHHMRCCAHRRGRPHARFDRIGDRLLKWCRRSGGGGGGGDGGVAEEPREVDAVARLPERRDLGPVQFVGQGRAIPDLFGGRDELAQAVTEEFSEPRAARRRLVRINRRIWRGRARSRRRRGAVGVAYVLGCAELLPTGRARPEVERGWGDCVATAAAAAAAATFDRAGGRRARDAGDGRARVSMSALGLDALGASRVIELCGAASKRSARPTRRLASMLRARWCAVQ
jgi:hypothetical protein